jgi:hypothetical protein
MRSAQKPSMYRPCFSPTSQFDLLRALHRLSAARTQILGVFLEMARWVHGDLGIED